MHVHIFNRQQRQKANQSTNVYQVTSPAGSIWFAADLESQRIALPNARSLSFYKQRKNCQLVFGGEGVEASGNFSCFIFFFRIQFFLNFEKSGSPNKKGLFCQENIANKKLCLNNTFFHQRPLGFWVDKNFRRCQGLRGIEMVKVSLPVTFFY